MPHTPTQFFWKYPPPPGILVVCRTQKVGLCARRSLRRPWKLGLRIVAWSKPRMFCKESLGKIKFGAFPKRVGPRILSLERVDYFGTSEHFWVGRKKIRILISKIAMIGCGKLSLYANGSCDEHAIGHDWNDVPCKSLFWSRNDVISLGLRPLNFHVFIRLYSLWLETYFRASLTRVLNKIRNK